MSTPILSVVVDAAQAIGDPNGERVSSGQWLSIYNRSNRELCQKANVLRIIDEFDLLALDPDTGQVMTKYPFPELMTVMNGIHTTETPEDETTFRWLREIWEDEFREMTSAFYPKGSQPEFYFATSSWFYLVPAVTDDIVAGACIDYFSLPDRVADLNGVLQIPDFAQDYLLRRMIIHADEARNRLAEAHAALEIWIADMDGLADKLEDRSIDRRSSIAPRRNPFKGMR